LAHPSKPAEARRDATLLHFYRDTFTRVRFEVDSRLLFTKFLSRSRLHGRFYHTVSHIGL